MALPLMTVSGIRGIVDETLTESFVAGIAFTQTTIAKAKKVVVGRDTRPSGARLAQAIFRGIRAAGAEPIDIGIAPTPTTCVATKALGADIGVIITASHNPNPYNGYKMVHGAGRMYNDDECKAVYQAFHAGIADSMPTVADTPATVVDAVPLHLEKILRVVDVAAVREAGISVAIDSTNGAGATIFPKLLEALGVKWVGVHNKLDGQFEHNPEPRPEHLLDLAALLKKTPGLWAGFAFDPDADRLAPMGEAGESISEEMTLALVLDAVLGRLQSNVATNLSTSMVIDDVAAKHGVKVFRTKIGEANVVAGLLANGCAIGGEGNGGVIYPAVATVRDGLTSLALILERMAKSGKRITRLVAELPSYAIVKEKITLAPGVTSAEVIDKLAAKFAGETLDRQDGLKVIWPKRWLHLRASNTEPILRCIAEATTVEEAESMCRLATSMI